MAFASLPDLLRLLAVPAFAWAAYRDHRTRRVPNELWPPLAALGVVLVVWDWLALPPDPALEALFLVRVGTSVLLVIPLAYVFWRIGGFGGADAKAFMVLAVLLPTYPTYRLADLSLADVSLPMAGATIGVFSLTVLTNAVLAGGLYPVALTARNAAAGRVSKLMAVGTAVHWTDLESTPGRILEGEDGYTRRGLDLDALRMYLRWRGATLADLRADPALRDPATLPDEPGDPTDGAVLADDGSTAVGAVLPDGGRAATETAETAEVAPATDPADSGADFDDPWGAAAFLESIEGSAYGTAPDQLRAGLDLAVERETVWVSPGIPFMLPLLAGLVVALTYGDVLFTVLRAVGLA